MYLNGCILQCSEGVSIKPDTRMQAVPCQSQQISSAKRFSLTNLWSSASYKTWWVASFPSLLFQRSNIWYALSLYSSGFSLWNAVSSASFNFNRRPSGFHDLPICCESSSRSSSDGVPFFTERIRRLLCFNRQFPHRCELNGTNSRLELIKYRWFVWNCLPKSWPRFIVYIGGAWSSGWV